MYRFSLAAVLTSWRNLESGVITVDQAADGLSSISSALGKLPGQWHSSWQEPWER